VASLAPSEEINPELPEEIIIEAVDLQNDAVFFQDLPLSSLFAYTLKSQKSPKDEITITIVTMKRCFIIQKKKNTWIFYFIQSQVY
jgi:hypothetical protein